MSGNMLDPRDLRLPLTTPGMRIGLFGGSFNPPHDGHLLVAEIALRRLALDQLWWIVTPGNPLKSTRELRPLAERVSQSRLLARHPKIRVTAFEAATRSRFSADTIAHVRRHRSDADFVWIMGADNLRSFHLWERWLDIMASLPVAIIDRPGATLSFLSSPMALRFSAARVPEEGAARLAGRSAPAWTFLHGPRSSLSSTALRNVAKASSDHA
jgi:nicotinate-nucleotide adenylyltransferase